MTTRLALLGASLLQACSAYHATYTRTVRPSELTEVTNQGELTSVRGESSYDKSAEVRIRQVDGRRVCFDVTTSTDLLYDLPLSEWIVHVDGVRAHFHTGTTSHSTSTTQTTEARPVTTVDAGRQSRTRYEYVNVEDVTGTVTRTGWVCGRRAARDRLRLDLVLPISERGYADAGAHFVWRLFTDG